MSTSNSMRTIVTRTVFRTTIMMNCPSQMPVSPSSAMKVKVYVRGMPNPHATVKEIFAAIHVSPVSVLVLSFKFSILSNLG